MDIKKGFVCLVLVLGLAGCGTDAVPATGSTQTGEVVAEGSGGLLEAANVEKCGSQGPNRYCGIIGNSYTSNAKLFISYDYRNENEAYTNEWIPVNGRSRKDWDADAYLANSKCTYNGKRGNGKWVKVSGISSPAVRVKC